MATDLESESLSSPWKCCISQGALDISESETNVSTQPDARYSLRPFFRSNPGFRNTQVESELARSGLQLSPSQIRQVQDYEWPGNVRELQNVIERAVIASRLGSVRLDLPASAESATGQSALQERSVVISDTEMNRRVRDNMVVALKRSGGKVYGPDGAAEALGVKPTTLYTRLKKLGLK
jgi:transcriptional regulator with GAF, ATPase, and Fis domain